MAKFEFGFEELWFRMIIKKLPGNPELFAAKEVENTQQVLRIGKLKVGAARIWAEAAGLIKKERKGHVLTPIGRAIAKFDPDMEEDGIWWLIHYNLASADSSAWFYSYFFNYFEYEEFDRPTLEAELREFWAQNHKPLTDDMFHKLIYSPFKQVFEGTRFGNGRASNGFRLFYETAPGAFSRDPKGSRQLHPAIVGYSICDWARKNERQTAHIEEFLSPGAPGRILRLNNSSLDEMLVAIGERYIKRVAWISHTANLNSVAISNLPALAMLVTYYLELDGKEPVGALEKAIGMVEGGEFGKWR
jgi:hypothetical protein